MIGIDYREYVRAYVQLGILGVCVVNVFCFIFCLRYHLEAIIFAYLFIKIFLIMNLVFICKRFKNIQLP